MDSAPEPYSSLSPPAGDGTRREGMGVEEDAGSSTVTQPGMFPQKDTDEEVREFLQNNLHLQGKVRLLNLQQKGA